MWNFQFNDNLYSYVIFRSLFLQRTSILNWKLDNTE